MCSVGVLLAWSDKVQIALYVFISLLKQRRFVTGRHQGDECKFPHFEASVPLDRL